MSKLPEVRAGMTLDQTLFLELLSMLVELVEEAIITEEKAGKRYVQRKKQFGLGRGLSGHNWDSFDDNFNGEKRA